MERKAVKILANGKMMHGGDYNPDQWLDHPEILAEDIELMKKAGVNSVSMGIFAWSTLEPEDGVYNFDWLEEIIDNLYENGIYTVLATPSGGIPHWMSTKYPEVCQVFPDGKRNLPGKRHNFCYTSPKMREKIYEMDTRLAKRFGKKEAVVLWHISNEMGGNSGDASCHCEHCQKAFREWLKKKYGTLDNLNKAWWSKFWSHVYTDWDQIHSPVPHGEIIAHALKLDWRRFVSHQLTDFCNFEIEAVKQYSDIPCTTNFMYTFKFINYFEQGKVLECTCWDNYPSWHQWPDEVETAVRAALNHNICRSVKRAPFLLMESTPSCVNWQSVNAMKRPGVHRLASLQAVAHGSNSVQYFQWRKSRGSSEKLHGAVVGHKYRGTNRVFNDVAGVGKALADISDAVVNTINKPKVAIVFDWENWWVVEDVQGPRADIDYVSEVVQAYQAFWEQGIDCDIVSLRSDISDYSMVVAPLTYMYPYDYADKVKAFVENGGTFITGYFSGIADETDLCFEIEHPLRDVLGMEQEEIDSPGPSWPNSFIYKGNRYEVGNIREVIHAMEGAKVLSTYEEDYYQGCPVVVNNQYGKGQSYYIAARTGLDFLRKFYADRCEELAIKNALNAQLPYGVTVTERKGDKDIIFVMNFSRDPQKIDIKGSFADIETGETYSNELNLNGFEAKILEHN